MRGVPKAEHAERVRRAAAMVELEGLLDRKPGALSGGQRQRAALARAIVRQPRVFLMDEPLSNLDAKLRSSMRVQIKHVQRELRITTVYVTHDQIEAMTLADRIVVMDKGRIQQIGTPDEIYADPATAFVAGFIGSPPMNLIRGAVRGGVFEAEGLRVEGAPIRDREGVLLGVRPEDARVAAPGEGMARGAVYGVEPTGEQTFLTVATGAGRLEVKAARSWRAPLDSPVGIDFDRDRLYFFDAASGARLRG
jgi:multiple sugar transport system ATP-binding protein